MSTSPLLNRVRSSWQAQPKWWRLSAVGTAAAGVLAVAAAVGVPALRRDPVERAVARGDLRAAQTELQQRQVAAAAAHSYDLGRIAEARRSYRVAAAKYGAATRQGEERGLQRLIEMTREPACAAREAAADALGKVRDARGVRALEELRRSKFADERKKSRRACDSKRAAREALKRARKV
jgi:hypothetical protein